LHLGGAEVLMADGTIDAPIASDVGSTITLTGDLSSARQPSTASTWLDDGHKAVLGSQTTLGSSADGTVNSDNGIELPDTRTFVGRGVANTLNGEFENQGFVQCNGTTGITFNHLVTGSGDFGDDGEPGCIFMGGTDFGNSPAKIDMGTGTFGATNTHTVEVGGLTAGSEFDQVNASGTLNVSGTLDVKLIDLGNGYTPQAGDSFDILTAVAGVNGRFDMENLPPSPTGSGWQVVYSSNSVTLVVVPVPQGATWNGDDPVGNAGDGTTWGDRDNWTVGGTIDVPPAVVPPGDDVTFPTGPTVGTISLGTDRTVNSVTLQADYTLAGNTLTVTTGDIVVDANVTATVDSDVASVGGLTKLGDGTLVIGGTALASMIDAGTFVLASSASVAGLTVGPGTTGILSGSVLGDLINDGTVHVGGDLNGDGALNATDIDLVYAQIPGTVPQVHPRMASVDVSRGTTHPSRTTLRSQSRLSHSLSGQSVSVPHEVPSEDQVAMHRRAAEVAAIDEVFAGLGSEFDSSAYHRRARQLKADDISWRS